MAKLVELQDCPECLEYVAYQGKTMRWRKNLTRLGDMEIFKCPKCNTKMYTKHVYIRVPKYWGPPGGRK